MENNQCALCFQNAEFCRRRSGRRAVSCDIQMIEHFRHHTVAPCYFKDRICDLANNNWLVAKTSGGHLYDLYVVKDGYRAIIGCPYWMSLMDERDVNMGDIVTITLFTDEAKVAKVFITVSHPNGQEKPHVVLLDPLSEVPECTRATLHKTIFSDITISHMTQEIMADMLWEMYKEVNMDSEDEFYHVPDLQYFVHRMTLWNFAAGSLMIPTEALRGYNVPANGRALYWHRSLDHPVEGLYSTEDGEYDFWENIVDIYDHLGMGINSIVLVKVEARESCIGLQVENLGVDLHEN